MLSIYEHPWDLDVEVCPCDVHFLDYLEAWGGPPRSIFHFGTGAHHVLGLRAVPAGHAILGITASPGEHEAYVRLVTATPRVAAGYKVLFGDIYQLDGRLLPHFDAVSLFHLCEFRGPANDAYGAMTDLELATLLTDHLVPDGRLLFYTGSMAYDRARPVIEALVAQRPLLAPEPDFKTLRVFRKAAG